MNRTEMIAAMDDPGSLWDVIIIGGGATGLGAAVESAARGHRTVLVEAADFAKGTSSRSTKLIHGGVRYLRQGRVGMVRQSLRERGLLFRNAPHVVHPLNFEVPHLRIIFKLADARSKIHHLKSGWLFGSRIKNQQDAVIGRYISIRQFLPCH